MYMYTGIHTNKFMRKMLGVLMLVAGMTRKIQIYIVVDKNFVI